MDLELLDALAVLGAKPDQAALRAIGWSDEELARREDALAKHLRRAFLSGDGQPFREAAAHYHRATRGRPVPRAAAPPQPAAGVTALGVILPIPGRELPFVGSSDRAADGLGAAATPPVVVPPPGGTALGVILPIPGRELPFVSSSDRTPESVPGGASTPPAPRAEPPSPPASLPSGTALGVVMPIPGRELPFAKAPERSAESLRPAPTSAPVLAQPGSPPPGGTAFGVVMPLPGRALPFQRPPPPSLGARAVPSSVTPWVEAPPSEEPSSAVTAEVQQYAQLVWDLERASPEARPAVFAKFGLDEARFRVVKRRLDAEIQKHAPYRTLYEAAYGAAGESLRMGLRR